jgi:hypothetical protein
MAPPSRCLTVEVVMADQAERKFGELLWTPQTRGNGLPAVRAARKSPETVCSIGLHDPRRVRQHTDAVLSKTAGSANPTTPPFEDA